MVNGDGVKLSKYPLLAIIPIVVDGLFVLFGMMMNGFHGVSHVTFKLALQMGLPSINTITEQSMMPGSIQISTGGGLGGTTALGALLLLALFLAVQSFLQGGYIGLLQEAAAGQELSMDRFAAYGSRFFGRFFVLNLLVMAFLFLLGALTISLLHVPGGILMMLIFIWLRVLFLYLEFTIVADDCSIGEAFSRSREAFRNRTPTTMQLVIAALVINIVGALLVNALWQPLVFLLLLVGYDLIAAQLQLAFMHDFRRIRGL